MKWNSKVEERVATQAAQSIQDDESLWEDLEDDAAEKLLEWGMRRARAIALSGLNAEARLRALRVVLRAINRLAAGADEQWGCVALAIEVADQAIVMCGGIVQ